MSTLTDQQPADTTVPASDDAIGVEPDKFHTDLAAWARVLNPDREQLRLACKSVEIPVKSRVDRHAW